MVQKGCLQRMIVPLTPKGNNNQWGSKALGNKALRNLVIPRLHPPTSPGREIEGPAVWTPYTIPSPSPSLEAGAVKNREPCYPRRHPAGAA
jgi:hypothetical protein